VVFINPEVQNLADTQSLGQAGTLLVQVTAAPLLLSFENAQMLHHQPVQFNNQTHREMSRCCHHWDWKIL